MRLRQIFFAAITMLFACALARADMTAHPDHKQSDKGYDKIVDWVAEGAARGRDQDPLRFLAGDMSEIVGDLSELKTNDPVQEKQKRVVGRLDDLIKQLEKSCSGAGSMKSRTPRKGMNASKISGGPGTERDMHAAKEGSKGWGNLPPKQREQIMQSKTQGFPAGYESILEKYYERLAREQAPGDASAKDAAPRDEPKK